MFAACTYEEIEQFERMVENKEIVVLLFARPTETGILQEFEYIHYNSHRYCSIYAVGYTNDFTKATDPSFRQLPSSIMPDQWYYSNKAFVDFKGKLEDRIKWRYSGETEVLVLQNNPGKRDVLNFQNYVAIDINKGIREGYIDSFQSFMESLIRSSKKEVTATEAIHEISKISLKDLLISSIENCKKIPTPVKLIVKDKLFYRCANSI